MRLKGKDMSLKRSTALPGEHPKHINLLETLNIFAIRANYMAQFRDYLEREGVETEPIIELPLFTWVNREALRQDLAVPRVPEDKEFWKHAFWKLEAGDHIRVRVDLSTRVQTLESTQAGLETTTGQAGGERRIPADSLTLVNWERVYLSLLDYKVRKGWANLILRPETPRQLMDQVDYALIANEATVHPRTFAERERLQQAVTAILQKYMESAYRRRRERWEAEYMEYRPLDEKDPNLAFNRQRVREERAAYIVQVRQSDKALIETVQDLLEEEERLRKEENGNLPRIAFDAHLYLPLLVEKADAFKSIPPALKESEARFVRDLKAYWEAEKEHTLKGKRIYLLRNLSRGKGIGFFEERGFYPDFILWVLDEKGQRIVFIEPHGMLNAKSYIHDEKARLHERLPEIAGAIAKRSGRSDIYLDSFIISATPYKKLKKRYDNGTWTKGKFAKKHILFFDENNSYNYIYNIVI